jgi:hypothetical protein
MKHLIIITVILFTAKYNSFAQGCVAIKSNGGYCTMPTHSIDTTAPKVWELTINNRYFKSFRHFVGTAEQKQRLAAGTEVINHAFTTNFNLLKNLKHGWSVAIDIPIISNTRTSLYEHGGKSRHSTESFGLGDIRLAAYKWLIDPAKMSKTNIQVGLGIKLATGDYKYTDKFYVNDSTNILGPVDQSIQLGDGGTGFTLELNGYYAISKKLNVYANFYYLANPREQNGTSTARGSNPSVTAVRYGSDVMSVPDQSMVRIGLNYSIKHLTFSAGMRNECLPSKDLIGGSNGFRRPGKILSVEPGITYDFKNWSIYTYVPFAVKRDRTQSAADKIRTSITGVYAQGDAAFADYAINTGIRFKF